MADDYYPPVLKTSASAEKAGRDTFHVAEDDGNEVSLSVEDSEIYQFLVAYQEGNAGRLVLDPGSVRHVAFAFALRLTCIKGCSSGVWRAYQQTTEALRRWL